MKCLMTGTSSHRITDQPYPTVDCIIMKVTNNTGTLSLDPVTSEAVRPYPKAKS